MTSESGGVLAGMLYVRTVGDKNYGPRLMHAVRELVIRVVYMYLIHVMGK